MRNMDSSYREVEPAVYRVTLTKARWDNVRIEASTSPAPMVTAHGGRCFLSVDGRSGFVVRDGGELCGVFSTVKGRGDSLVAEALFQGATHLDCFDGYLPTLYARHGFREARREPNWVAGQPDVVYMRL